MVPTYVVVSGVIERVELSPTDITFTLLINQYVSTLKRQTPLTVSGKITLPGPAPSDVPDTSKGGGWGFLARVSGVRRRFIWQNGGYISVEGVLAASTRMSDGGVSISIDNVEEVTLFGKAVQLPPVFNLAGVFSRRIGLFSILAHSEHL